MTALAALTGATIDSIVRPESKAAELPYQVTTMTDDKKMQNTKKVQRITSQRAAFILKEEGIACNEDKITRWCRDGVLKNARKIGGQWYINEEELREMLN